jgi:hypothetical protein
MSFSSGSLKMSGLFTLALDGRGAAFFGTAVFAGTAFFTAFVADAGLATVCAVGTLSIKMAALSNMGASVMNT